MARDKTSGFSQPSSFMILQKAYETAKVAITYPKTGIVKIHKQQLITMDENVLKPDFEKRGSLLLDLNPRTTRIILKMKIMSATKKG